MKTDVIHVSSDGTGINEALAQAEAVAVYKSLPAKNALHLRLLTEEMMGMVRALTGKREADFWIEDQNGSYQLHLKTETAMNTLLREKLLEVSTTGQNKEATTFMGKLRDMFERSLEPDETGRDPLMHSGMMTGSGVTSIDSAAAGVWSFSLYKSALAKGEGPQEDWDQLEKSIVANVADEVEIGIKDNQVEMVIYKKF